jgi:ABC-type oligopeptide transport system substrate-binding subunit
VKGSLAIGIEPIYDSLMVPALDEVSAEYGLLAEGACYPDDFSYVIYRLRPQARWHDGRPVTPGDVIFSFEAFRKLHPQLAAYYRHVVKAVQTGERDITFWFDQPGNRELPQIVGQLNILPQHWWEGVDTAGNKRDVAATTLENRCLVVGPPHQGLRPRPIDRLRARAGLLGQGFAGECRPRQFRRNPLGVLPRYYCCAPLRYCLQ